MLDGFTGSREMSEARAIGKRPTLGTERLILRPFMAADGEMLHTLYGDPRVMAIRKIGPQSRAQSDAQLAEILRHWRKHGFGLYAVFDKAGGTFIGECGLRHIEPDDDEIELSYGLIPEAWGRGYATEASAAVLAQGFGELGLTTIYAIARSDNVRSHRVMQKLGMHLVEEIDKGEKRIVRYAIDSPE